MADEIKMSGSLVISDGNLRETYNAGTISIDLADGKGSGGVLAVGTATEVIPKTDTAAGGVYFFRNTDATNYVEIGLTSNDAVGGTFYPMIKLLAGEFSIGRLSNEDIFARANTGAINLQYRMLSP
tara:strand:+ start:94 stop:471 length:378 start_codon:yes stop_codon:yes gene_type:complete